MNWHTRQRLFVMVMGWASHVQPIQTRWGFVDPYSILYQARVRYIRRREMDRTRP